MRIPHFCKDATIKMELLKDETGINGSTCSPPSPYFMQYPQACHKSSLFISVELYTLLRHILQPFFFARDYFKQSFCLSILFLILPLISNLPPVDFTFLGSCPNIPIIRGIRLWTLRFRQGSHLYHDGKFGSPPQ